MVKRKISKNKYLLSFLITLVVFTLGLLLGLVVDSKRVQMMELRDEEQTVDFNSLQLQYQFVDLFGEEKNCDALKKTFEESIKNLESARNKVEGYAKDSSINKEEFNLLKRGYVLAQIRFWFLTKKTKDVCDLEYSTIFYFYTDDCSKCSSQAYVLTYLKNKMGINLLNFAFDADFEEEPLVGIFKEAYDINEYPTLVINGKKFEGLVSKETILDEICQSYRKTDVDLCAGKVVFIS